MCHRDYQASVEGSVQTIKCRFEELKNATNLDAFLQRENQLELVPNGRRQQSRDAIRINMDATIRGNQSFLGVVAWKEDGKILEAHAFKVNINNPLAVELMAIQRAILVSIKNGWEDIVCESDAQTAINYLNDANRKKMQWKVEPIVKDILSSCRLFSSINFVWCNRSLNRVAHLLAKWVASNDYTDLLRHDCFPKSLVDSLTKE